jgi:phosphosulfolactate synthase (CoM biosynthesis protein A)
MSLKPIKGGGKMSPNRLQQQRNGLLALVHIAKKDLGLTDEEYHACVTALGAGSAGALSISELERLMKHFKKMGFVKGQRSAVGGQKSGVGSQVTALQERIRSIAQDMENGEARMTGLVKAKCGVDDLRFCRDVKKLKQVLRVMTLIKGQRSEVGSQKSEDK